MDVKQLNVALQLHLCITKTVISKVGHECFISGSRKTEMVCLELLPKNKDVQVALIQFVFLIQQLSVADNGLTALSALDPDFSKAGGISAKVVHNSSFGRFPVSDRGQFLNQSNRLDLLAVQLSARSTGRHRGCPCCIVKSRYHPSDRLHGSIHRFTAAQRIEADCPFSNFPIGITNDAMAATIFIGNFHLQQ